MQKPPPKCGTLTWDKACGAHICGSVYEAAPLDYLIDFYIYRRRSRTPKPQAQLIGLNAADPDDLSLPVRDTARSAVWPLTPFRFIWKIRSSPQWGLKRSTSLPRGLVSGGDNVLIGGFIVSGTQPKSARFGRWGHRSAASGFPVCSGIRF